MNSQSNQKQHQQHQQQDHHHRLTEQQPHQPHQQHQQQQLQQPLHRSSAGAAAAASTVSDMASIRPSAPVMEGASSPSSPCRVGPQSTRPSDHADCTTLRAEVDVERHDPSYSAPPSSPDGSHQSGLTDGKDLGMHGPKGAHLQWDGSRQDGGRLPLSSAGLSGSQRHKQKHMKIYKSILTDSRKEEGLLIRGSTQLQDLLYTPVDKAFYSTLFSHTTRQEGEWRQPPPVSAIRNADFSLSNMKRYAMRSTALR